MKPRTVRSVSTVRGALIGSAFTLGWIAFAVFSSKGLIVGTVFAAFFVVMTWRASRVGIRVESNGVKVVDFLGSRRVAWEDIDHFAVLPLGRYPWTGYVVLRDGRRFGTLGISAPGRPRRERFRRQVQEPVDQLNSALEQWRAEHGAEHSPRLPQ